MVQQENDMLRSGGGGRHLCPPSRAGTPCSLGGNGRQPMSPHTFGGNMVRVAALASSDPVVADGQHFPQWCVGDIDASIAPCVDNRDQRLGQVTTVHRKQAIFTSGAPLSPGALGGAGSAHLVTVRTIVCANALRQPILGTVVVLEELSRLQTQTLCAPGFGGASLDGRRPQARLGNSMGRRAPDSCCQPDQMFRTKVSLALRFQGHCRADTFGHSLSPLRSNSNLLPDKWSPAPAAGHQSLRHLLNGSGSAQRRQHEFQHNPHMPNGASRTPTST